MLLNTLLWKLIKPTHHNEIILIIDSDPNDRDYITSTVIGGGYNVLKASNGKEGEMFCHRYTPDLVIVDFNLSDMSGIEFCRDIKKEKRLRHVPIVVLTAVNTPQAILESYEQEVEAFYNKPIERGFLLKMIKETLEKSKD